MSRPDRVLSMLGIAMKAGKVVSGETSTETAVKNLTAYLVIIAEDASANTKKHFMDMCEYRGIPVITYSTRENLGRAIGKDFRSNLAITDEGLADAVQRSMEEENI